MHQLPVWQVAVRAAADPQRVRHQLQQLADTPAAPSLVRAAREQARILAALFSGSPALGETLAAHPDWLKELEPESLRHPRRAQGMLREVESWLGRALRAQDYAAALARLREFKQREMLRIAARDLARLGDTLQITREISDVADVCLRAVLEVCQRPLSERLGQPFHQTAAGAWQPTPFAVIGLGKLGGQELNYSSDVDVIFVYEEEGVVAREPPRQAGPPERALSNHQFFKRLAETFIAEVSRPAAEGTLFRIDLRLRPEGDAGPLVRSLAGYENYYAQWGQTWERMMLLKGRWVAGEGALAHEFLEMVQSFRHPRSLNQGVLREVSAIKERIEVEVVGAAALGRNVKLGRGGIREIEFVVQTLQLLHAGRCPFLQGAQTVPLLQKLVQYGHLTPAEADQLAAAYGFLRDVEHRLQMEQNLQTHTLPTAPAARARLARLMGCRSLRAFEAALHEHQRRVRAVYDRLLKGEPAPEPLPFPKRFQGAETEWKRILAEHRFRDPDKGLKLLNEFAHGPGYVHVSPRTVELAWQLVPRILALCPKKTTAVPPVAPAPSAVPAYDPKARWLSDPDRVVTRLDSFVSAYGARATLFEMWAGHPSLFELLLLLFDRSEFLAERAIRTPDLMDELVLGGRLSRRKSADEILEDLRHGADDADQHLWLRRYFQVEQMRIGLRDLLGLADFEHNLAELTALAEACLQYALEVVLRKHRFRTTPLAIVGLGKLGGQELTYGSDLDLVFVTEGPARNLPKLQRLAADVLDLLSAKTEQGTVFVTDARLRPDGEKGLLVNTLEACADYYRRRAQLWEIQAVSRARTVAGDRALGARLEGLLAALTDFTPANVTAGFTGCAARSNGAGASSGPRRSPGATCGGRGLAAYTPDWRREIARMRARIEKERTHAGQEALAFKTGTGGLVDAEFIAQALCLAHGWHEPNTLRALERARDTGTLEGSDAARLIENYRELRRIEGILRRWSFEGETELPVDAAPYYRVSVRCGFSTPEAFRDAVAGYRRAVREVYLKVFAS